MFDKKSAIFLDRDGVINSVSKRKGLSPRLFSDFEILPNVKETLELFKNFGYLNLVLTNQPDISRGLMDSSELEKMCRLLKNQLPIDDIMICTHDNEDNCSCRKPKPGMLFDLAIKWEIDLNKSFFIGDSIKDLLAAKEANVSFIHIKHKYNKKIKNIKSVNSLIQTVELILSKSK